MKLHPPALPVNKKGGSMTDRIREETAEEIMGVGFVKKAGFVKEDCLYITDQIFSIKRGGRTLKELIELQEKGKLLVEAENQELPEPISLQWWDYHKCEGYHRGQQEMLKEGWVRCLKKEER